MSVSIMSGPPQETTKDRTQTKDRPNPRTEIKIPDPARKSTAVEQVVACALVTQRARVRSPVGTGFLGALFSGFFLTCQINVRKL